MIGGMALGEVVDYQVAVGNDTHGPVPLHDDHRTYVLLRHQLGHLADGAHRRGCGHVGVHHVTYTHCGPPCIRVNQVRLCETASPPAHDRPVSPDGSTVRAAA